MMLCKFSFPCLSTLIDLRMNGLKEENSFQESRLNIRTDS